MIQVTYDGTTWEDVEFKRGIGVLRVFAINPYEILDEMKKNPELVIKTGVSAYRWVEV